MVTRSAVPTKCLPGFSVRYRQGPDRLSVVGHSGLPSGSPLFVVAGQRDTTPIAREPQSTGATFRLIRYEAFSHHDLRYGGV